MDKAKIIETDFLDRYYSGTSGLLLPVRNKLFYPDEFKDKSRLTFYSSIMNSIEINSSFYKIPMATTVQKWTKEVPDDFKFTFKLFKEITHHKQLAFDPALVKQFMEVISFAGDKKGCLLVQFPPSVSIAQVKQLDLLMQTLRLEDSQRAWSIALEFRHVSLYCDDIYSMLEDYGLGMVVQDKPLAPTPILETELPFIYLRFHGPCGNYRGTYEDDLLYEYATYIKEWLLAGKTVYTYFNNTMGSAIENLHSLKTMVNY